MNISSILLTSIFVSLILIAGCSQLIEKGKEGTPPEVDQEVLSRFMSSLNTYSSDHIGSYKREFEVHLWGGHSGATDYTEESEIFIEVKDGEVVDYTLTHQGRGGNYREYFDKLDGRLCKEYIMGRSECVVSETPIPPQMIGLVEGCEVESDGGKHSCICEGNKVSISVTEDIDPILPCVESVQTQGLELWDEFNIIYYAGMDQSLCYFVTKSEKPRFAFECLNEDIKLIPTGINTDEELENLVCRYSRYNHLCSCSFDSIKTVPSCETTTPEDFDLMIKKEILDYLGGIEITSIIEDREDNCYTLSRNSLEHIFCFDENNLITFAQWGSNIREDRRTNVGINKVKRI